MQKRRGSNLNYLFDKFLVHHLYMCTKIFDIMFAHNISLMLLTFVFKKSLFSF